MSSMAPRAVRSLGAALGLAACEQLGEKTPAARRHQTRLATPALTTWDSTRHDRNGHNATMPRPWSTPGLITAQWCWPAAYRDLAWDARSAREMSDDWT